VQDVFKKYPGRRFTNNKYNTNVSRNARAGLRYKSYRFEQSGHCTRVRITVCSTIRVVFLTNDFPRTDTNHSSSVSDDSPPVDPFRNIRSRRRRTRETRHARTEISIRAPINYGKRTECRPGQTAVTPSAFATLESAGESNNRFGSTGTVRQPNVGQPRRSNTG